MKIKRRTFKDNQSYFDFLHRHQGIRIIEVAAIIQKIKRYKTYEIVLIYRDKKRKKNHGRIKTEQCA